MCSETKRRTSGNLSATYEGGVTRKSRHSLLGTISSYQLYRKIWAEDLMSPKSPCKPSYPFLANCLAKVFIQMCEFMPRYSVDKPSLCPSVTKAVILCLNRFL